MPNGVFHEEWNSTQSPDASLVHLNFETKTVIQREIQAARTAKEAFGVKVYQLLEQGRNLMYSAVPDYRGDSFIPSQITVQVSADQSLTETITVW